MPALVRVRVREGTAHKLKSKGVSAIENLRLLFKNNEYLNHKELSTEHAYEKSINHFKYKVGHFLSPPASPGGTLDLITLLDIAGL